MDNEVTETINREYKDRLFKFIFGKDTEPETLKLKLSDSFLGEQRDIGDFEWSATVLNLRPDEEVPLNKNCTPLYHYTKFISMITANIEAGMDNQKAVEKAVDDAIKEKLLGDFFKVNKAEVIGMCMTEFDEELAINTWRQDGRTEKAIEDAKKLLADGKYTAEEISGLLGIPVEAFVETVQA